MLGGDGHGAQGAAQGQRTGVAHEYPGGRGVVPEEAQASADHGPAERQELAGARDEVDLQVVGELHVADQIGDQAEGGGRDHHRRDRQPVQSVGKVDGVGGAHDHHRAEHHIEPAKIDQQVLQ